MAPVWCFRVTLVVNAHRMLGVFSWRRAAHDWVETQLPAQGGTHDVKIFITCGIHELHTFGLHCIPVAYLPALLFFDTTPVRREQEVRRIV